MDTPVERLIDTRAAQMFPTLAPAEVERLRRFGSVRTHDQGDALVRVGETGHGLRSEEHTSELQSLMRISYAVFCLKKKKKTLKQHHYSQSQQTTAAGIKKNELP